MNDTVESVVADLFGTGEHPAWLAKEMRHSASQVLRNTWPTGVAPRAGSRIRDALLEILISRDGSLRPDKYVTCCICGLPCPPVGALIQIDHLIPLSQGGRHDIENMGLAHRECNQFKRTRVDLLPEDARDHLFGWIEHRGWSGGHLGRILKQAAIELELGKEEPARP